MKLFKFKLIFFFFFLDETAISRICISNAHIKEGNKGLYFKKTAVCVKRPVFLSKDQPG